MTLNTEQCDTEYLLCLVDFFWYAKCRYAKCCGASKAASKLNTILTNFLVIVNLDIQCLLYKAF